MMQRKQAGLLGKISVHILQFGKILPSNRPRFEYLIDFALVVISVLWSLADFWLCTRLSLATRHVCAIIRGRNSRPHQSQGDAAQSNLVIRIQSSFIVA